MTDAKKLGAAQSAGGEPSPAGNDEGPFGEARIAINRVYTKKGDGGHTSLVGGQKVPKNTARIEAYGTIDELNCFVGHCRVSALAAASDASDASRKADLERLAASLLRIQHELFNLGSILATLPEDVHEKQPRVTEVEVAALEAEMDAMNAHLEPLRSFVLPGGSRLNADLHVARTVCRRAERLLVGLTQSSAEGDRIDPVDVRYVNRLSDTFFVMSRAAALYEGAPEVLWKPNEAASGRG
jgi:cob(I)alamin adenosyltransferase